MNKLIYILSIVSILLLMSCMNNSSGTSDVFKVQKIKININDSVIHSDKNLINLLFSGYIYEDMMNIDKFIFTEDSLFVFDKSNRMMEKVKYQLFTKKEGIKIIGIKGSQYILISVDERNVYCLCGDNLCFDLLKVNPVAH